MTTPHTPENWGAASRAYAEQAPRMMGSLAEALIERLDRGPDHDALEVAAGTGALTLRLAPRVRSLLATDFAPGMIEVLQERLAAAGVAGVTCEVMNGQALACADASFDPAACSFGVMLFPDRAKGFSELHRVLRPGGRVAVSGWAGPPEFDAFRIFLTALTIAFPDMPAPPGPPRVFSLADPASFAAQMEAAGFTEIRIDKVSGAVRSRRRELERPPQESARTGCRGPLRHRAHPPEQHGHQRLRRRGLRGRSTRPSWQRTRHSPASRR